MFVGLKILNISDRKRLKTHRGASCSRNYRINKRTEAEFYVSRAAVYKLTLTRQKEGFSDALGLFHMSI